MTSDYAGTFTETIGETEEERREREAGSGADKPKAAAIRFEPVGTYRDPATIPRRQWLYSKHYIIGHVSTTIAAGGIGKTNLSIAEGIALATGRDFLGVRVPEPVNVLYWNGEEPIDEIERRVHAICQHHSVDPAELTNKFFMMSGLKPEHSILIARLQAGNLIFDEPCIARIEEMVTRLKIKLLTLDPFVSIHRVPENDNTNIEAVVGRLAVVADRCRIAIDIDHHVRKSQGNFGEMTTDDARGASALVNKSRNSRVLNRMTPQQAQSAKVDDHREYIRSDNGKANYAPAFAATWFKIVPIELPNGDKVGVLEPWEHPGAFDAVKPEHIDAVRARIRSNDSYRADPQSPEWVGHVIAEVVGLDANVEADRKSINKIIKTWIDNGLFFKVPRKDETRRFRTYITADRPTPKKGEPPSNHNVVSVDFGKAERAAEETPRRAEREAEAASRKAALTALGVVIGAWRNAIGVGQTRTLDQIIEIASSQDAGLKSALLTIAAMDDGATVSNVLLARWLRDFNEVPVDGLMLQGGGIDGSTGSPWWTLVAG